MAAEKKQENVVPQPSLCTSKAEGITSLLQETLMCPHFNNSVPSSPSGVWRCWKGRKNNLVTTGMEQLLYKVRWQLRIVQPGEGKAHEPGAENPGGNEVSECEII